MLEFFENSNEVVRYIIVVSIGMIAFLVIMVPYMAIKKKKTKAWAEANPRACKIYVKRRALLKESIGIFIKAVDGVKGIQNFQERAKSGFYVEPGKHEIEASCLVSANGNGITTRYVDTTFGPIKLEVHLYPSRSYELSFNEATSSFEFEEL